MIGVRNFSQIMALRFLLGFFESALVPGLLLGKLNQLDLFRFVSLVQAGDEVLIPLRSYESYDNVVQPDRNATTFRSVDRDEWCSSRSNARHLLGSWTRRYIDSRPMAAYFPLPRSRQRCNRRCLGMLS